MVRGTRLWRVPRGPSPTPGPAPGSWPPTRLPVPERSSRVHELSHVIRRVIGDEQQLAQVRLPLAVWDGREQVDGRVRRESLDRGEIILVRGEAAVPGLVGGRRGVFGPVVVRPVRLAVVGLHAEVEDV